MPLSKGDTDGHIHFVYIHKQTMNSHVTKYLETVRQTQSRSHFST